MEATPGIEPGFTVLQSRRVTLTPVRVTRLALIILIFLTGKSVYLDEL